MKQAEWTPLARNDLGEILYHIAVEDGRPETAEQLAAEIQKRCDEYSQAYVDGSVLGGARPEFGIGYRVFSHKRWVIVFRPLDDRGIEIMRVLDSSRDYGKLF